MTLQPTLASKLRLTLAALCLAASSITAWSADTAAFTAALSGTAEVPANASAAKGTLEASLDRSTGILRWSLTYDGLSGPATMAHFHGPALPGANAGVVVPFPIASSPSTGQATLTAAQITDLMDGKWYANVHTAAFPGGEIRGQVMVKPAQ